MPEYALLFWGRTITAKYLIFAHAGGAAEKDREDWQNARVAEFVRSIPEGKVQDLADALLGNRVCTRVPLASYATSDYAGFDLGAFATTRLPWDYKHADFKASAAHLLREYRSKVVAVSDATLTAPSLLRAWQARMPEDKSAARLWDRLKGKTLAEIKEAKAGAHAPPTGEARTFPGRPGSNRDHFTVHPRAKKPRACKGD